MAQRRGSALSVALPALALGVVGAIALLTPRRARANQPSRKIIPDKPARLTEYYPDLPDTASKAQKELEGGAVARDRSIPVISLDQHRADPARYPFATVAADDALEGRKIRAGYGPRVYFAAFPTDVFRIYDTGSHFRGKTKKPGLGEPFDLAVSYSGPLKGTIGRTLTVYAVDWDDVLPFPERLRTRRDV